MRLYGTFTVSVSRSGGQLLKQTNLYQTLGMLPASGTNGRHTEDNLQNKTGDGKKLFFTILQDKIKQEVKGLLDVLFFIVNFIQQH